MFTINQKVVCIDDNIPEYRKSLHFSLPIKDCIYTIRGFCIEGGIYLDGIYSMINPYKNVEYSFNSKRFRSIVKTQFDLTIFKEILNTTKIQEYT